MGYYAILLSLSFWLNRNDLRMLALTFFVGAGIFFPVPDENFYLYCISIEIIVLVVADIVNVNASKFVMGCLCILISSHLLGMIFDGYLEDSPYRILVPLFEYAQIVACIVCAKRSIKYFNVIWKELNKEIVDLFTKGKS